MYKRQNLTGWIDFTGAVPDSAEHVGNGALVFEASKDQLFDAIASGGVDDDTQTVLRAVHTCLVTSDIDHLYNLTVQHGLRADSPGAPRTYNEAISRGPPWPAAISKEFLNHASNESWKMMDRSTVPAGRRIHKFVWVLSLIQMGQLKRDFASKGVHSRKA